MRVFGEVGCLDDCISVSVWVGGGGGEVQERPAQALQSSRDSQSLLTKALEEFVALVLPFSHTGWVNQGSTNMWKPRSQEDE